MRFLCLFKPDPATPPPEGKCLEDLRKYIEDSYASGVLLATEGFQPSPKDVRVRLTRGEFTVTDGPFTESKELIGGYAILKLDSREEAIAHAKDFLRRVGGGESEIHELPDAPPHAVGRATR